MKKILVIGTLLISSLTVKADLIWNKYTTIGEIVEYANGSKELEKDDTLIVYITKLMDSGITENELMIIMTDSLYQIEAQRMGEDAMLQLMSNPNTEINISKKGKDILQKHYIRLKNEGKIR